MTECPDKLEPLYIAQVCVKNKPKKTFTMPFWVLFVFTTLMLSSIGYLVITGVL